MKKLLALTALAAAFFAAGYGYGRWYGPFGAGKQASAPAPRPAQYHCPMHPHMKSDKPDNCPICGMKMVLDDAAPQTPPGTPQQSGAVAITAEKQQWIGLKTGVVEMTPVSDVVRVPGKVVVDETRVIRVQTRFEGWIDKVMVDSTSRLVKKGEPMLTLYSPELVASQQEYLLALKAKDTLGHSGVPGVTHATFSLADSARMRLEHHWGMSPAAIEQLEKTGEPQRTTTVIAPETGFVTERKAYANQMVKPEMELYTLADLSHVWILADIFESDAGQIRMGQSAEVEPSYAPGHKFRARVTTIQPQMDAQTRTLKVRLEADNPGLALRPDQFVNVEFAFGGGTKLTVPQDALIDTGQTQIVYVTTGEGKFEPRQVKAGERFDGRVEILSGLTAGEHIVVSGAFLVDSESRMKSGGR
jgi:Cu(I)/Ag(I) efflux system membrane fusion protein